MAGQASFQGASREVGQTGRAVQVTRPAENRNPGKGGIKWPNRQKVTCGVFGKATCQHPGCQLTGKNYNGRFLWAWVRTGEAGGDDPRWGEAVFSPLPASCLLE